MKRQSSSRPKPQTQVLGSPSAAAAPKSRPWLWAGLVAAFIVVGVIVATTSGDDDGDVDAIETPEIAGLQTSKITERNHMQPVRYDHTPPRGGSHSPVWANCGFYESEIIPEQGVHSMEHGAVWITYAPDLAEAQRTTLSQLADVGDYVLVSPFDDLPSPVVATAWGVQVALDGADDPRLGAFIDAYEQGPQAPEAGAPCTGGAG